MVSLTPSPTDPSKAVLTVTITLYLDRLLSDVLSDEIAGQIREQATKDLRSNKQVRKMIQDAASEKLLSMLGAPEVAEVAQEKREG
jgi:hypothetical protein